MKKLIFLSGGASCGKTTALKILIEENGSITDMTDEELENERIRLLNILAESESKN